MSAPLPTWVIKLVAAIQRSEEEHPRYFGDFYNGLRRLEKCPQQEFLALIPEDVRVGATSRDSSQVGAARLLIHMLEKDGDPVPDALRTIAGEQP